MIVDVVTSKNHTTSRNSKSNIDSPKIMRSSITNNNNNDKDVGVIVGSVQDN
jgi:hypothetical protein